MTRFELTPEATADLDAIADYVAANSGVLRAVQVVTDLENAVRQVSAMPGIGHFRDDLLGRRYKFWAVHSFLIAYEWEARPIRVIAVVHGARSLAATLRRRVP